MRARTQNNKNNFFTLYEKNAEPSNLKLVVPTGGYA